MQPPPNTTCFNHPTVPADRACAVCGRAFCHSCLVPFLGEWLCGPCRDLRLRAMQTPVGSGDAPLAGTGHIDLIGWLQRGWRLIAPDILTWALAALVAGLGTIVTCGIAGPALGCGLYMMAYQAMTQGRAEFGTLFRGLQRFVPALLIGLVLFAVTLGIVGAMVVVQGIVGEGVVGQFLSNLLSLAAIPVQAYLFFALPHVAARNASAGEALRVSGEMFARSPWMLMATAAVYNILSQLGFVACCVGALVTIPWIMAAQAVGYAEHFGVQGWESA